MDRGLHFGKAEASPFLGGAGRAEQASTVSKEYRKAGLLDLPFIFRQILDGCAEASYSNCFLTTGGSLHLWRLLFVNLLPFGKLLGKHKLYDFLVFRQGEEKLGYVGMYLYTDKVEPKGAMIIGFYGVAREHRGKKIGSLMMRSLLARLPDDAKVAAYTTKHSVCMQHLLIRAGFRQVHEFCTTEKKVYLLDKSQIR